MTLQASEALYEYRKLQNLIDTNLELAHFSYHVATRNAALNRADKLIKEYLIAETRYLSFGEIWSLILGYSFWKRDSNREAELNWITVTWD